MSIKCPVLWHFSLFLNSVHRKPLGIYFGVLLMAIFSVAQADVRLINISTRAPVEGGAGDIIAGFIIEGTGTQRVVIRGWDLEPGVDPKLTLQKYPSGDFVASNDNWKTDPRYSEIPSYMTTGFDDIDAALLLDLPAGAYTVTLSSVGKKGIGLVGVDAVDDTSISLIKLINISARAPVQGGAGDIIAGFIIEGTGTQRVVIRGWDLEPGVDPKLTLQKYPNGDFVASNDNWKTDLRYSEIPSDMTTGFDDIDAALLLDLAVGAYTVTLSSVGAKGIGLVGVDKVTTPPPPLPPCSELITPFDPDSQSATASPGYGFDGDRDRLKPASCLNGFEQPVSSGGRISVLSADQITGYENLYNSLEGSKTKAAEVSVGFFYKVFDIGIGGGGSDTKRFLSTVTNTKLSQSFVYRFEMLSSNNEFKLDTTQSSSLNELGKRLKGNVCQFRATCGDQFVYQTERGVSLYVALTFNFNSEAQKQTFHKEMSGHFGMTLDKIGSLAKKSLFEVQADWSGFTNRISESLKQSSSLSITAAQIGGDVAALTTIMRSSEGTAAISCSLNSVDGCKQTIDNIIDYAASEAFVDGARNAPAVLNYLYQPYAAVGVFIPGLTSELTLDIKDMRERLATAYKERDEDYKTASFLESYNLTDAHQQAIDIIKENLSIDLKKIRDAANICFSDLSRCVDEGKSTLSRLTDYDESVLELWLDDGLILNWTFDDCTATDSSGNSRHGSFKKGEPECKEGAIYFDGKGKSIEIPLDISPESISVALWFNVPKPKTYYPRFFYFDGHKKSYNFAAGVKGTHPTYIQQKTIGKVGSHFAFPGKPVVRGQSLDIAPTNTWNFVVVNANFVTRKFEFWMNGILQSIDDIPSSLASPAFEKLMLGISPPGAYGGQHLTYLTGTLDEFRVYGRTLFEYEIQALYNLK